MSNDLKDAFSFNDKSGNGKLNINELEDAARCLGKTPTTAEIKQALSEMGKSDQDKFSFEDFCTFQDKLKRDLFNSEDLVRQSFMVFDKNEDGLISSAELRQILTRLGDKLTEEQANTLIKDADPESLGRVDYNEFLKRMAALAS